MKVMRTRENADSKDKAASEIKMISLHSQRHIIRQIFEPFRNYFRVLNSETVY